MTSLRHLTPAVLALGLGALAALAGTASGQSRQAQAPDAVTFTFQGRGWGHGVGLSQYGARGRALAGWDGGRILRHYYRGAALTVVKRRSVRVLLAEDRRSVAVTSEGPWRVVGARVTGPRALRLPAGVVHTLRALPGGRVALAREGRRVAVFTGTPQVRSTAPGGTVSWGPRAPEAGRTYRGALRAVPDGDGFSLVNVLGLEDYLKGVVPREMPASWGDDAFAALVAQAVAARTYAIATMSPTETYDVFDDTRSQAYGGASGEDPRTTRAVQATRGTVLTYRGDVITAFFFSTSGGRTENVENVFSASGPQPYLVSVPDPYDKGSPYHLRWPDPPTFTAARLGSLLGLDGPAADVTITRRGVSPRVVEARVTSASGRQTLVSGTELRQSLGLRDTWFSVTRRPATVASR